MTRIVSSALRPLRLSSGRALQLTTENAHQAAVPLGRRTAATYVPRSTTSSPPASKPTPQYAQLTYKRSATTSSSSSTPSNSSSAPKPTSTSSTAATKPPTSAYAESQINRVDYPPYRPPPGVGSIPETPSSASAPPYQPSSYGSEANGFAANNGIDWSSSFHGLSTTPFSPEVSAVLMKPIPFEDVEVKPDGIIYLPEIKYRRILNQAFGPGGWGMAPRGELQVGERIVTREYALLVHGRFIAQARGECQFFGNDDGVATAGEGCKSNALMRCCKDLGIASELWDPRYIRDFKKKYVQDIWVEHVVNKKKRQISIRKGDDPAYPYKKSTFGA